MRARRQQKETQAHLQAQCRVTEAEEELKQWENKKKGGQLKHQQQSAGWRWGWSAPKISNLTDRLRGGTHVGHKQNEQDRRDRQHIDASSDYKDSKTARAHGTLFSTTTKCVSGHSDSDCEAPLAKQGKMYNGRDDDQCLANLEEQLKESPNLLPSPPAPPPAPPPPPMPPPPTTLSDSGPPPSILRPPPPPPLPPPPPEIRSNQKSQNHVSTAEITSNSDTQEDLKQSFAVAYQRLQVRL